MKNILLLTFLCISFTTLAQSYRTVEAPIGFLRDEPKVTATILLKIEEKARVKIIEEISRTWSKVEYVSQSKVHTGYITNHTLSDEAITRKKKPAAKSE
jgi:uncharacterized protein YgiM (DUF1202 family)